MNTKEYVRTCGRLSTTLWNEDGKLLGRSVSIDVYSNDNDDRFLRVCGSKSRIADRKLTQAERDEMFDSDDNQEFDLACKIMHLTHSF